MLGCACVCACACACVCAYVLMDTCMRLHGWRHCHESIRSTVRPRRFLSNPMHLPHECTINHNAVAHTHIHTHTHKHTHTYTHIHTHTRTYTHIHTHTHTCVRACVHAWVRAGRGPRWKGVVAFHVAGSFADERRAVACVLRPSNRAVRAWASRPPALRCGVQRAAEPHRHQ